MNPRNHRKTNPPENAVTESFSQNDRAERFWTQQRTHAKKQEKHKVSLREYGRNCILLKSIPLEAFKNRYAGHLNEMSKACKQVLSDISVKYYSARSF